MMALGSSHMPPVTRPFNMAAWRIVWGAFWGPANREAINAAIRTGSVTTAPGQFGKFTGTHAVGKGKR